ncbi:hypothetical protein H257_16336 [Aphanomyces astaci]|uniref:Metallo-beta-lactamase domain-containing protein n=1 Tax=Aphanomyces astaci TaxID=112090 RepID=W4FJ01_APHAT|nr:hypothetical protein H257_16336 [Aphanomyces astaci]ETV67465.1 hypothetical protein H257_16336 [Aphanomyces astaci]|eukprot:XP_009843024.1 hypothetical protein H257_16336 [Aphanomyces astaci]
MDAIPTDPPVHVHSIAGKASCCYVDSMNVAFDMGVNFVKSVVQDHVFISHGHIDHIQALPAHAAERQLTGMKPATYYMPSHLVPHMEQIMISYSKMQESDIAAVLVGVDAGSIVHISPKVAVKAFATAHRVASLGYVAYSISKTLKGEFVGLPGRELGALRKQNVVLEDITWVPSVAYTGDTCIEFFDQHDRCADFLRAAVLVTEVPISCVQALTVCAKCTFLGDTSAESKADETGHLHLNQLARRMHRFVNSSLVLTHFSARYSFQYIQDTLTRQLLPPPHDANDEVVRRIFMAYGDRWAAVTRPPSPPAPPAVASDKPTQS